MKVAAELSESIVEDQVPGAMARAMHAKAAECHPDGAILQRSHFSTELRRTAVALITDWFEKATLRDDLAVASLALLDRVAVCREMGGFVGTGDVTVSGAKKCAERISNFSVEVLAVVLIVLKQSSVEAELDDVCVRDIMFHMLRVSTTEWKCEWWPRIRKAEIAIYSDVEYRVCIPTPLDLVGRIAIDVCKVARSAAPATSTWPGLSEVRLPAPRRELASPTPLFTVLAGFLVELGLAHAHEDVYMHGTPPAVLSLAALHLALHAFECKPPEAAARVVETASQELLEREEATVALPRLASLLLALWAAPPDSSHVAAKWSRRMLSLPKAPSRLPPGLGRELQTPERKAAVLPMELSSGPKSLKAAAKHQQSHHGAVATKTFEFSSSCDPLLSPQFCPERAPDVSVLPSAPSAWISSSATTANLPAGNEFEAQISKEWNSNLGVHVVGRGSTLLICSVQGHGLVHEWNMSNPQLTIQSHDKIVAVNGVSGDPDAMKDECRTKCHLRLVVHRMPQARPAPDAQYIGADALQTSGTAVSEPNSFAAKAACALLKTTAMGFGTKRPAAPCLPKVPMDVPTAKRIRC